MLHDIRGRYADPRLGPYAALVKGAAAGGDAEICFELLNLIRRDGVEADGKTLLAIVSTVGEAREDLWDRALAVFRSVVESKQDAEGYRAALRPRDGGLRGCAHDLQVPPGERRELAAQRAAHRRRSRQHLLPQALQAMRFFARLARHASLWHTERSGRVEAANV